MLKITLIYVSVNSKTTEPISINFFKQETRLFYPYNFMKSFCRNSICEIYFTAIQKFAQFALDVTKIIFIDLSLTKALHRIYCWGKIFQYTVRYLKRDSSFKTRYF